MKCLVGSFFLTLVLACGGAVEGKNENPAPAPGGCDACSDREPPPFYELCGFAGKVNDGEQCPAQAKGESCESYRQPTCEDPLPKVQCTCDGTKFVCGLPPKCPPPTVDAGKPD